MSLLWGGDDITFLASPQVLVCHPRLDKRFELGPQINTVELILVYDRGVSVYWVPAIPSEAVYTSSVNGNSSRYRGPRLPMESLSRTHSTTTPTVLGNRTGLCGTLPTTTGTYKMGRQVRTRLRIGRRTRKQEERAFWDRNVSELVVFDDFQEHISFPLEEKFLTPPRQLDYLSMGRL